jgi:hypothetical protein
MMSGLLLGMVLLLLSHSGLAAFQRVRITEQALLSHYSPKKTFEMYGAYLVVLLSI